MSKLTPTKPVKKPTDPTRQTSDTELPIKTQALVAFWEDQAEQFAAHADRAKGAKALILDGNPDGWRFLPFSAALIARRIRVHLEEVLTLLEYLGLTLPEGWECGVAAEVRGKVAKAGFPPAAGSATPRTAPARRSKASAAVQATPTRTSDGRGARCGNRKGAGR